MALKLDGVFYTWSKGTDEPISSHFRSSEFECDCSYACGEQRVAKLLIDKLERIREHIGQPLIITSGYRCSRHQAELRSLGFQTAKTTSQHELGKAADVRCAHLTTLYPLCEKEFKAIGMAKTFLHLDLRDDKVRRWTYA
jgi:zinc D-Ala-D-Ala carboxypeptidase